jgi:hypothetical protein
MGNIVDHIETVGSGGASNVQSYSLASNTFAVGKVIRKTASDYALADSDDEATSDEVLGVVTTAGDPSFSVTTEGPATLTAHGFTGNVYLSTNGDLTDVVPTSGVYKQIGIVTGTDTIHVRIGDTIVIGGDSNYAFQHFVLTGDGTSTNFDLPVDIAGTSQVLVEVNGKIQGPSNYTINGDGNGNPRRITFDEAPDLDVEINVHYLGIVKPVAEITPVSSTDYNSGTPVALALTSTTDISNIQSNDNFSFAHGLGVKPKDVNIVLRCLGTDLNYSIGDELGIAGFTRGSFSIATVNVSSTNIELYFDKTATGIITIVDKSTNLPGTIDLSKWGVVVYANAEMGGTNGVISAVNTPATEFESAPVVLGTAATTWKTQDNFIFPHGLSQKPKSVRVVLINNDPEHGYSVGDELGLWGFEAASLNTPAMVVADSTNIQLLPDPALPTIQITRKDSPYDNQTADLTKWAVKVYANSELGGYKGDRGPAGTGKIAQVKYETIIGDGITGTGIIPQDDTLPQNTEGDLLLTVQITPKNPDSTLIIEPSIHVSQAVGLALFIDDNTDATFATREFGTYDQNAKWFLPSGGTNTRTYKLRIGLTGAGTWYLNYGSGANNLGGIISSVMSVTEILP